MSQTASNTVTRTTTSTDAPARYVFIIDVAKCENCNNCFLACKDEHCGNEWPGYAAPQPLHGQRWINIMQRERGAFPQIDAAYLPMPCSHCDDAPCVAAGGGAVTRRTDGIVLIDPLRAKGKKELLKSCPHGAIYWNEELQVPQKCTLCAHLLDAGWKEPRCVQACPTGALSVFRGTEEEIADKMACEELRSRTAVQVGGTPRTLYRNLYRYDRCCIRGSLARKVASVEDCVVGARIVLSHQGELLDEQYTDEFGDFLFDDLRPDSGKYVLEIFSGDSSPRKLEIELRDSVALGVISLE